MVKHGPCPLQVGKFVGTICLGLATGISFSTTQIILPTLQSLPSAPTAHQALTALQSRLRQKTQWLTGTAACTFLMAYRFASKAKCRKHPYLLYVSTLALVGGWGIQSWCDRGLVYDVLRQPFSLAIKGVINVVVLLGFEDHYRFTTGADGYRSSSGDGGDGEGDGSAGWDWSYGLGCLPPSPTNMSAPPSSSTSSPAPAPAAGAAPPRSADLHSRGSTSSSSSSTTMVGSRRRAQYTPSVSIATLSEEDASASLAGSGVFIVNGNVSGYGYGNGNGAEEEELVRNGEREMLVMTPSITSRPATPTPNGESVAWMIDAEDRLARASLNMLGTAFVMAVVGIWGDNY